MNKKVYKSMMRNKLDYKNVEGYILDTQQISCIENNSMNTLVIAGAGTGKTTTIIGKIKWILAKWKAENISKPPPQILVVSFTHASRNELEGRILAEILCDDKILKIYPPMFFIMVEILNCLAQKI